MAKSHQQPVQCTVSVTQASAGPSWTRPGGYTLPGQPQSKPSRASRTCVTEGHLADVGYLARREIDWDPLMRSKVLRQQD